VLTILAEKLFTCGTSPQGSADEDAGYDRESAGREYPRRDYNQNDRKLGRDLNAHNSKFSTGQRHAVVHVGAVPALPQYFW